MAAPGEEETFTCESHPASRYDVLRRAFCFPAPPVCGSVSLTDTKRPENLAQKLIWSDLPGDFTQRILSGTHILRQ